MIQLVSQIQILQCQLQLELYKILNFIFSHFREFMTHLFKNYETTKMARKNRDVVEEVSLNASGEVSLDLDNQDDIRDLIPLRNIQVVNTGNTDLEMYINQQRQGYKVIPSNTLYTRNAQKIKNLKFVNRSSTTATTFSVLLDNDYSLEELKLMELGIEK